MSELSDAGSSEEKRPQFGTRYLTSETDVFQHNAWDDVDWTDEQVQEAEEKIQGQLVHRLSDEKKNFYIDSSDQFWDKFYGTHQNKFFKDRHWLFTEFPELLDDKISKIFEVGCGVGNTVFPILTTRRDSDLFIYCCDISSVAIDLLQKHPSFDSTRCEPFVCDITLDEFDFPFEKSSLDAVICVFALSAVQPSKIDSVIKKMVGYLKPGGLLLFRDYGRYDMAQMRFKTGHCLGENLYVRGDGTTAYFFSPEEIDSFLTNAGLVKNSLVTDRRLQVNRGKQLKMYRVWVQAKYTKPLL
ncbi:methyltransferase-like protein [Brevipalpus obovatus]|uniref:methyltransferase-like protein n=1 Tax=Brevipalpus obovatus TaxID=246614 RepID=UPI003D9E850B